MAKSKKTTVSVRYPGVRSLDKRAKQRIGKKVLAAVRAEVDNEVAGQEDGFTAHCTFTNNYGLSGN